MQPMQEAYALADQLVTWRRELHKIPESGLILPKTAAYVCKQLDDMGVAYRTYAEHSGIVALLGKRAGKTVALRADMDGLVIREQTDLPYHSENENMHACGHDGHTAMLLGVAKILKEHEGELNGQIKLIFQPGEEGPGGAEPMVRDGVLENPKVDYILAMHLGELAGNYSTGDVVVSYSSTFAADDQFVLRIRGKGGHGSTPDRCIDPVSIAALAITQMQHIISREVAPVTSAVITFACMEAGRGAYNIISDEAVLKGTIRAVNMETRDFIMRRMREIMSGLASGMRAEFELEFLDGYPPLINDRQIVGRFLSSAKKLMPEENIHVMESGLMGGEDAAFFFREVPGCYAFLCNAEADDRDGIVYPAHNARFRMDDSVLYKGTALFVQAATDLLA